MSTKPHFPLMFHRTIPVRNLESPTEWFQRSSPEVTMTACVHSQLQSPGSVRMKNSGEFRGSLRARRRHRKSLDFLAGDMSAYVTGQCSFICEGIVLAPNQAGSAFHARCTRRRNTPRTSCG